MPFMTRCDAVERAGIALFALLVGLLTLPCACAALEQILPPPFYPDPHAGVNNGHYFGGGGMWRPPYPSPAGFPQVSAAQN